VVRSAGSPLDAQHLQQTDGRMLVSGCDLKDEESLGGVLELSRPLA
jgi:hypothetical protein